MDVSDGASSGGPIIITGRLNPKIDFVFRKLFGSEENKDLLISLLNGVVEPDPPIVDVSIKNPFNLATYRGSKESILDIRAVDENGVWYDVEMQVEAHVLYGRRAVYYLAKTYADQLDTGDDYSHLNTAIGIHFLDFRYFDDERVVRQFVFQDTLTHDAPPELGAVRLYFVEMPKFDKDWPEIRTALDRWVAFLNRGEDLDHKALPPQLAGDPAVARAVVELERAGLSSEERDVYEGEVKRRMVDTTQLRTARQEGRQEGVQEGVQLGRQEGIRLGRQEGVQEGKLTLLLRLMAHRFGVVPSTLSDRLQRLNADVLDDLTVALLDFDSYATVEQWLARN